MGAGVGAVACIDNEPSPRRAAIEKTQTELRREVAVRDERRRELEFLERGGNPLDFKFKEATIGFWSASPTGRAAEQLLPSDGKSSHPLSNWANGDFIEKKLEHGLHFKRTWDIAGNSCFDESDAATNSSESTPLDTLAKSISTSIEHDQGVRSKNGFDSCKGIRAGLKGQYARRNRQKGNRFSNGYAASKDPGKNGVEDSTPNCSSGIRALHQSDVEARGIAKEREIQVSEGQNSLLSSGTAIVSGFKQDIVSVVSSDNIIKLDATMAVSEPSVLQISHKTDIAGRVEWNEDAQNKERLPPTSVCRDGKERGFLTVETTGSRSVNSLSVQDKASQQGFNGDKGSAEIVNAKDSNGRLTKVGNSLKLDGEDRCPLNVAQNVEKGLINQKESLESCAHQNSYGTQSTSHSLEAHGSDLKSGPVNILNSTLEPICECDIGHGKVETVGSSCMVIKSSNDRLIHEGHGFGEVKVKLEEGISDQTLSPSVRVNGSDGKPMGISGSREASALQTQYREGVGAGSAVDTAVCLQGKDNNKSLASSNDLDSQEKKDSIAVTKQKANVSAAARKAHEDVIIEEAETIKASLKHNAEWAKRKAFPEPPRRKSHWDFVLEEMAWLANDFMQERLWKTAAAAQVARWIANEKRQLEFRETELYNRQLKIARNVADAVTKYWYSIEALLHKDLARAGSNLTSSCSNNKLDGGAVPMEIDVASPCEVHKMEVEKTKMKENKNLPIQEYAVRFLKNSIGCSLVTQAEAPPTPDRVSEVGVFEFWEDQFPEESLFYTVPNGAMEVYRQSIESQWGIVQAEYEQRLLEHEAALAEADGQAAAEGMEDSVGISDFGPSIFPNEARSLTDLGGVLLSPHITGKRTSGMCGPSNISSSGIPTKRLRTSTRQRAAGVTGPSHNLMACSAGHLVRSDMSSGETNSQQDDIANLPEGSSISGRATDAESSGAFGRNMLADGVDSPFRSKKKKKIKHFSGGVSNAAACDVGGSIFSPGKIVDSEQSWQPNVHRLGEQREQQKQKGEQLSQIGISSPGSDGLALHLGAGNTNKFIKQISNRERGRKYKAAKAPLSQLGNGIPWSSAEDQAIIGLVYELGLNWELVSDILSSSSQLKGIFRKAKDCKDRYKMLTERSAGDGGDSPEDSSSSTPHPYMSGNQKGGTRFLPQHLEETLKSHMECILQLHQQHCSRKLQTDSQEQKQLVSEHASHLVKQSGLTGGPLTPLELCEQSSTTGDLAPQAYSIQPAHGNGLGIPGMLASGSGMRLASSGVPFLHGANNLQLSPGMSTSAAINLAATRDAQRMAASLRPLTAEEQRLRYNRMVAGRGLQTQPLSVTSGLPLMGLPSPTDCGVPMLSSGNSVGMMCGLSIGMPLSRTGLPGMSSPGVPNMSSGMNNIVPSAGAGLPGSGAITPAGVTGPMNMMGRPRENIPMVRAGQQKLIQEFQQQAAQGHAQAAAGVNNLNSSLSNTVVSSPSQNFMVQHQQQQQQQQQQQLQQHNHLYQQQQNPGTNQQQAYNMMLAKERQKLQNQQQKRMQQQQFSTNNTTPLQASQSHPISQQHQPPHLLPQQNALPASQPQQQSGPQTQPVVVSSTSTNMQQSGQSPSALPSLNTNIQSPQQQQALSQTQPLPPATAAQLSIPSKQPHQNQLARQQQLQQGKSSKGMGRGVAPIQNISAQQQGQSSMIPGPLPAHLAGQQMPHSLQGQRVFQAPIQSGQHLVSVPQNAMGAKTNQLQASVQNLEINLSQVPTAVAQQQRGFSHHHPGKQLPQQQLPPISTSAATSFVQPASPPSGSSASQQTQLSMSPQQQPSSQQQRRVGQQSQTQQCRSQRQAGSNVGMQLPPQPGKNGLQPSVVPPQLSGQPGHMAFQLGSNVNNPLSMASPPAGIPLSSPISTSTGGIPSSHWKPAQNFSPIAAGIYNLSRSNSAAAAQAAHLMPTVTSNGNPAVASSSILTHGISAGGLQQQATEHAGGTHSQKPSVGPTAIARAVPASQQITPSQRQQSQLQQHGIVQPPPMTNSIGAAQVRAPAAASSGVAPAPASAMAGGSPSRANLALQTNMPSQPVSGSVLLYNGVQHRQTHQPGVVVTQGLPAPVTTSPPPVPAAGSVPSSVAGTSSISAVPKSPH